MASATTRAKRKSGKGDPALVEFLDLAGHELRIPITAMKGQLQLMQRRLRKEEDREADLADVGRILFQVERMNHALEVVLEAAHIEQGRLHLMPAPNDLVGVVQRMVVTYSSASRAHTLALTAPETPLIANVDRARIELVLGILLTNALKYSSGGEIGIVVSADSAHARIEVSDQGIGVPKKDRARIFQPYTRGTNVENGGMGLGLFVARAVIARHSGRMGVRANREAGSTFWFTLPLHAHEDGD